jgi:hypothetical protein
VRRQLEDELGDDSDGVDGVDTDSGLLEPEDSLDDRGVQDVLDEGISPADGPWAVNDWGTTAREAAGHENLDRRLAAGDPRIRHSRRRWSWRLHRH